jgi:4-hydroxy 2-oxovalerate aldolase
MYRPEIKVCDCTIRDGGLMNASNFSIETVRAVYKAACESGIDMVELGYKNSKKMFSTEEFGLWRFCDEDVLRQVTDGIENNGTAIAVMQDAHKAFAEDVLPKEESVIDIIRVATYVKDVDKAIFLVNSAKEKGYRTTINIMAISSVSERELDEALEQIEKETSVEAVYIVDSFGAMYSEDIDYWVAKFQNILKTKEVGIHCHNQQQLAYANTIQGIIKGANYVDGTLYGFGRAAGNCPTELLLGFLKNPKYTIRPIIEVIGTDIMPIRETTDWGYSVPYMISGMLNLHPQDAMAMQAKAAGKSKDKYDYAAFYDKMAEEDFLN